MNSYIIKRLYVDQYHSMMPFESKPSFSLSLFHENFREFIQSEEPLL